VLDTNTGEDSTQERVEFSAVSKNGASLELVSYPANEMQRHALNPSRQGWVFEGWLDADGQALSAENIVDGKTYYANWVDKVPPVLTVSCTTDTAAIQEVTMQAEDIASTLYGYYVGTENPETTEVIYSENSGNEYKAQIDRPGKYYFSVKDACGNSSTQSMEFVFASFQMGEGESAACDKILGRVGDMLLLPKAQKKGHTLKGWLLEKEAGEEEVVPVMEYTFEKEEVFLPVFEPNQYQLYFDGNSGNCDIQNIAVTFGNVYPELPVASKTGYHFMGWSCEKDGSTLSTEKIYDTDGDSTLYAQWEPIHYTIRYMGNGNTGGEMESMTCIYDVAFTHPRNGYTRDGYIFKGWSTSPETISTQNALTAREREHNGAEWLNEDVAVNVTAEANAEIMLYAVWQKIEVGVMDYRYCMGQYMYFVCTTLNYKTENAEDNGALFVGLTPAGEGTVYGESAEWATSAIRANLNDMALNDMTGLKKTDTTVNYTYAGMMWEYNPTKEAPCTEADKGYGAKIKRSALSNKVETMDFIFIPDLRDCYNYYTGNDWNWFWDMNLDGSADTGKLTGMSSSGATAEYKECTNKLAEKWKNMGWYNRYWLRNQYTGYSKYPFYIAEYGVSACNPTYGEYKAYANLASTGKYLVRPMYTMTP